VAAQEVQSYIERIEKKFEFPQSQSPLQTSPTITAPPIVYDDMGKVVMQATQAQARPKIVLPIDKGELEKGLHSKVWDGFRWLAEWCMFMIKKYPGRVFYPVKR